MIEKSELVKRISLTGLEFKRTSPHPLAYCLSGMKCRIFMGQHDESKTLRFPLSKAQETGKFPGRRPSIGDEYCVANHAG